MKNRPSIGVTLDYCTNDAYALKPWYAIRADYIEGLYAFGANVVLLHYSYGCVDELLSGLDGLVISGGDFDIDPSLYNEDIKHHSVKVNDVRSRFEASLLKSALNSSKMPILGICGGQQLINVLLGGSLIQDIQDSVPNCIQHQQGAPKYEPTHDVMVKNDSMLFDILSTDRIMVNTTHHQAVKDLGIGLKVSAVASDGVIEAIEGGDRSRYIMGVQWHPEYCHTQWDRMIMGDFVLRCRS